MRKSTLTTKSIQKPTSSKVIPSNKSIKQHQVLNTVKYTYHNYQNLTNQQYLFHSLKLLGITQNQYLKQTKLAMSDQIFGKNQSATNTKQFYFIVHNCLKFLCNEEDFNMIKIWYPPRNVNEQLQFKKALYAVLTKLQSKNKIPKKLIISKTFLMGQTPQNKIIQFLRILAQLALRSQYLLKYSKKIRLIDIELNQIQNPQKQPNDINRFYIYPFTPTQFSNTNVPPLEQNQIDALKSVLKTHIQIYRKKILTLGSLYPKQQPISCQNLMSQIVQQKQIQDKLNKKIPKSVFSENRSFDRRRIIDKSKYVWSQLNKLQCYFIEKNQIPILKLQGQIDKILGKWQTQTGINKMIDINQKTLKLKALKDKCKHKLEQLRKFNEKIKIQFSKTQK